ncbi:LuxR C-terminal-related transcriptional regulator [Nonomuraea glycinis]|uniref:Helix-turn-helix transcriptional regulator n=1 Tax=Nonomuraea glycinis TaxID=2047744 RepID=A0A918E7X8_9ACTN|nr:helix-turn-helix transcriptional regulator [Nonomuraea glycinis]MCA2179843.1 LuxR C-terminal-related transcriptional regulator [Nonomuraea glycinis]GGP10356.1 helix-turn-helix transcriptional regulator [Nonomuraea glycinis]
MEAGDWSDPRQVLGAAISVLEVPPEDTSEQLSAVLSEPLPHRALAILTGDCSRSPMRKVGERGVADRISSAELGRLAGTVDIGVPRFETALVGGEKRPVLSVASAPHGTSGALLTVVVADGIEPAPHTQQVVQRLWDLISLRLSAYAAQAHPVPLAGNRMAAQERARAISELTDAHTAALSALLGALRSRTLDDGAARRAATDIAVSALIELRAAGDLDRSLTEETAHEAFTRLEERLAPLIRYSEVALELVPPEPSRRLLPSDIAHAARAVVRGGVLLMLEQDGIGRIRIQWQLADAGLRVSLRDDGPGALSADALTMHRLADRVASLGGELSLDAVPDWGTHIFVELPLSAQETPSADALQGLNPRELQVLERITKGLRNRSIAEELQISEHTVKYHVRNILEKLKAGSRGEAAALARGAQRPLV